VAQEGRCLSACAIAAFATLPQSRNICFNACAQTPQTNCNTVRELKEYRHARLGYRDSSTNLGIFLWIYKGRASFRDPPLIFLKFVCCFAIEIFNLKNPMWLMQKTYILPVQIGMPLQMHLKSVGYTDTVLFLTIGNEVRSPDVG
jgi:hypothetical protein